MSEADEIRDLYRQYLQAQQKGDAAAVASLYTDDAILIPPEHRPIKWRSEVCKFYEGPASSGVEMDLNHIEIKGNLAWVTGPAHWKADGEHRHLAFLDVWRREDGRWRLAGCMWSSSDGFV